MIGNQRTSVRGAPLLRPLQEIFEERRKFNEADLKRRIGLYRLGRIVLFDETHLLYKETENV